MRSEDLSLSIYKDVHYNKLVKNQCLEYCVEQYAQFAEFLHNQVTFLHSFHSSDTI